MMHAPLVRASHAHRSPCTEKVVPVFVKMHAAMSHQQLPHSILALQLCRGATIRIRLRRNAHPLEVAVRQPDLLCRLRLHFPFNTHPKRKWRTCIFAGMHLCN